MLKLSKSTYIMKEDRRYGMELYVDIFLMENLIMNYIVLWLSSKLLGVKLKSYRIFLGGGIGAIYALAAFLFGLTGDLPGMILKLAVSVLIIFVTYGKAPLKAFIRNIVSFYITSFLMAGIGLMLIYSFNISGEVTNGVFYWKSEADYFTVIVMVLFALLIIKCAADLLKWRAYKGSGIVDIELGLGGKTVRSKALVDTGNKLEEPITGMPVVIVERNEIGDILPEDIKAIEETYKKDAVEAYMERKGKNLYLVPFTSVGKQNGMLLGIKPDYIKILTGEHQGYAKHGILGLCNEQLSSGKDYHALINPEILAYEKTGGA